MMKFLSSDLTVLVEHTQGIEKHKNKVRNVISRVAER